MIIVLFGLVFYFRDLLPNNPVPDMHQTGDVFLGGIWEGKYLGDQPGSSPTSKVTNLSAGSSGYYRCLTFSSSSFSAQSCPADTWKILLYSSESNPANNAYLRFMIYTWDFVNDTIGQIIVPATNGNNEFPTTKGYIIESAYGNSFNLNDGDKICVDIIIDARSPGNSGRTGTVYYDGSDTSKIYSPITLLSSNLVELSAILDNEGVILRFNGRENSRGSYWKVLRKDSFENKFKIIDSVFIKSNNMHNYIDKNVEEGNEYQYEIYDEFRNIFGPVKVFVSKLGYNFSITPYSSISKDKFVLLFSSDEDGECSIEIFSKDGRSVKKLLNKRINKGLHSIVWDGKDKNNVDVPQDVYFYSYNLNNRKITGKIIKLD